MESTSLRRAGWQRFLGPGNRFESDAQLAAYAGVAPLEASSAGKVRHRLNRGGNRRLNHVLYFIVLTQAHHHPEAKAYLARRVAEGQITKGGPPCTETLPRPRDLEAMARMPGEPGQQKLRSSRLVLLHIGASHRVLNGE